MTPISVLYVSARYPPFVGGTEIHTAEVATRMAARGHSVDVLTTAFQPLPTGSVTHDGVTVTSVRARPADYDVYLAPSVYRWIASRRWDVVHCQGYHTMVAPLAMAAAIASHQNLVVTFHSGGHSSIVRRALRPAQRAVLRPLLRRTARLIGVSEFETEFFRHHLQLPKEQFATVTNGVSSDFFGLDGESPQRGTTLCSVGRLQRYKGHHRVIAALPEVRRLIPDVRLRIVGDGPYRRELVELARRLGVGDIVDFIVVDPARRREMAEVFRSSDLVTLLSDYESQGVVGLEALAVGRPLLVADGTALAELGRYGNVSIVPPHVDGRDLGWLIAQKLQRGMEHTPNLVPMWEQTVDELSAIYEEVVGSGDRRVDVAR